MRISLHHLTLSEVTVPEFTEIAAAAGCDHICLFIKVPGEQALKFPRVETVQAARELKQRAANLGLSVWNTDTFMMQPDVRVADYRETLEISVALGAKTINAVNLIPDSNAAVEVLASFSKLAAPHGLTVILEWFRHAETNTLQGALDLLRRADQPNLKLNVDILHLIRNGGQPADLAAVDPALMNYAQISDGPLVQPEEKQWEESLNERNFPGEEEFPSVSFIQHLPVDGILSIEAPVNRFRSSMTPLQRAKRAVAGTRRLLEAAGR